MPGLSALSKRTPAQQPEATTGGNAAILMQRLAIAMENANVLVLGDSTGVINANPWPLLLARWLAAKFPAYSVNYRVWSDASQAYYALGAATTFPSGIEPQVGSQVIQTGTGTGNAGGPFVLNVYNASVSGAQAGYPRATAVRWTALTNIAPNLVLINYGHNNTGQTGQTYRSTHFPLCRAIQQAYPEAGVIEIAQNPRATTDNGSGYAADRSNDLIRARAVMSLASSEGHGLVNITQRFLADPAYATTLMQPDGLHPNDTAGGAAWADEVQKHLVQGLRSVPRGPHNRPLELFIPAAQFAVASGSATLGAVNGGSPSWALPAAAATGLVTTFVPPEHWSTYDIFAMWTFQTGNSGQSVAWQIQVRNEGPGITDVQLDGSVAAPSAWSNLIGAPNYLTQTASSAAGSYPMRGVRLASGATVGSRPMGLLITRRGDVTAADTFAATAYFIGARLIRAT